MYTIRPHDKLIKRLSNIVGFVVEGGNRTHICIPKIDVAYCGKKAKDNIAFRKSTLKASLKHLMQSCYFMIYFIIHYSDRKKVSQWELTQLHFGKNTYENEYMSELISNDKVKARHFTSS